MLIKQLIFLLILFLLLVLIVSGGYWDRWEVIIWFDELMKHELLTLEEVKSITGLTEDEILNEREKYTKRK